MPKTPRQPMTVSEAGRLGGHATARKTTPEQRSLFARMAVNARWRRYRASERAKAVQSKADDGNGQ